MEYGKLEILVIEDDLAAAGMIKRMLSESRKPEFTMQHTRFLADGLSLARSREFDVILCDLGLPDSQGLETALALRRQVKRTPIIVLTVLDDEDAALKALQMDIQDYLVKGEMNGSILNRSIRYAIQRKRDSEAYRESEARFAAFMLHLPAAAWIKGLDGRYVYANAEAEQFFSTAPHGFLGKTDDELFPPQTACQFRENDQRALTERGTLQTIEVLRHADGLVHHLLVNKFAIPGPDGQPAYVAGVAFDISETKRQEAEILRLASFPRLNPAPILELNAQGRMVYCNSAAQEILEKMELGSGANPFIPADLSAIVRELQGKSLPYLRREVTVDGTVFEETVCLTPQYDAVRIYTVDITNRKLAEKERERLLLQLESVLESINEGVVVSDLQANVLTMNREALALFEYESIEQVRGPLSEYEDSFELFDVQGRLVPRVAWPLRRVLSGETFADYEVLVRRKDTGKKWLFSFSGTPVRTASGDVILAVITFRDITERQRADEAIRGQAALLDLAHDGIMARCANDKITFWSRGSTDTYGWTRQEAMGQVTHHLLKTCFPKPLVEIMAELTEKGGWEGELIHTRKDGRVITVASRWAAQRDSSGRYVGVLEINRDISDRKRAEGALIQAKEEWERTFNSVPDLIAIVDDQQRIVRMNQAMAQRLGRKPEDWLRLPCYKVIHGTDAPPDFCPHIKTLADAAEHSGEIFEAGLGGHFLVTATPLLSPDGKMYGVVHVARDITERKRAEEEIARLNADLAARVSELEEANEALEAFNRMVSHDLRQPLNNMSLSIQAVEMLCSEKLDKDCKDYVRAIRNRILAMNDLINTLLKFSSSTLTEVQREYINLSEIAESIATEVRLTEPNRRVTINIAQNLFTNGDSKLLRSVLENLIGNAWKYTAIRKDAVIEFGATVIDGKQAFFVRDNGKGFDMADADKLFAPLKRLPGSEEVGGFGIGLATVDRIIRRHGGKVWGEGEPGKGATFYFTLPADGAGDAS